MKESLKKNLKEALFLENRGFKNEAKRHYDQVKGHFDLLNVEELTFVSKFYDSLDESNIVLQASRLGIAKLGDIRELAPLFILAWEKVSRDIGELEWLLNQPGMDYLSVERLVIAKHLFRYGKTDKAYMVSLEVANKMERLFRNNPSEFTFYVHALLNLIELEYVFKNFNQARFHLRKLLFLNKERMTRIQDIAYWAAILDEIPSLVIRSDWSEFEATLSGDVLIICQFYRELSQRALTKQTVDQLQEQPFKDVILESKRNSYLRLIMKLKGGVDWFEGIEEDRIQAPDDLLTTLLYADYLKAVRPEELKTFWKAEFPKHADRAEAVKAYWNISKKEEKESLNLDDCTITFFGGGEKIGGTSILVSVKGHHLLLDAGMHLHEDVYHPDYSPLSEQGLSFEDIDALLITHAHMDHTGAVPYVHNLRKDLPIHATEATVRLMKLLLTDSVRIGKEQSSNMYSEEDIQSTLLSINNVDFNKTFTIPSKEGEWKITYYPSGHILGAAAIHMEIEGISILFTGDYSVGEQKTVTGLSLPDNLQVDVLITESTYGFLPTNASMDRTKQEKLFIESIKRTMDKGGSMLIPAFAVGRAQEIILILKDSFKNEKYLPFNLYLDGRVTDVCRVYQRFSEQHRYINPAFYQSEETEPLFFGGGVQSAQEIYSNRRNSDFTFVDFIEDYIASGNNCIVASSGMLTVNSASARYAEYLIEEERNSISFTGYMDEESPGHHVIQTAKADVDETVRVNGVDKKLHARIESFRLSAHASREQIVQLIADLQPKRVFLMHGEHNKKFEPTQAIVGGEKIYPTVINLLGHLKKEIEVTPAYNGKTYFLDKRG
ncbi:MBL fold metallo-hydrolase [Neobacillus niacini]|uniref:MBL fold metallo-hydrolase n=1 Tax=Neobacillus niacini TaxID=86668 RepID=UPI0007AB280E|nr:MBL fold metallo-hydrolase [Neobacillus niacini]MEC1526070.1 MBL fold metallo-hydrolase [Neobacillus niacini]